MTLTNHRQPVVLFDAVGTLIYPSPPAFDVYHKVGNEFGIHFSPNAIATRFKDAFKATFLEPGSRYQVPASESDEKIKWQRVVASVFGAAFTDRLFDELWNHFAQSDNWTCYPDAHKTIEALQESDIRVGIASNFDSRLLPITRRLLPGVSTKLTFCSTLIGFAKPDVRFFKKIERQLTDDLGPVRLLMIGDNWKFDVEAPRRAGWHSHWKSSPQLPTPNEMMGYFFRKM